MLIIGYGNLSRRDDGVAYHVIQRLRERLGLPPYGEEEESKFEADQEPQGLVMVLVHQLAPELAERMSRYHVVVFVDAHVAGAGWDPVHWQEVEPGYRSGIVSHHLSPASVLALCHSLYGRSPRGYILSVEGHDFDFGEDLAPDTSARADQAVARLLGLIEATGICI